ncbi:MAG: CBS domain-containing protein [Candidatus Binatia bacterium]
MSVGRICVREIDLVAAEESALVAARRMAERQVGTLIVLNETKRPIGLITDRDLVLRVLAAGKDPHSVRVGDIMTRDPKIVSEEGAIEAALALMRAGSFRRLPVVGRDGELVGILSLDDILTLLAEEFAHIGGIVERRK